MDVVKLLSPFDQPANTLRLRNILEESLEEIEVFSEFIFAVAYAKSGILKELEDKFKQWKEQGNSLKALVGVDQKITSVEAITFLADVFDEAKIINHKATTFHPKVFVFKGEHKAKIIIGSNNFTHGGMELNFESAAVIEYNLGDEKDLESFTSFYDGIINLESEENGISLEINADTIEKLQSNGLLATETRVPGVASQASENFRRHSVLNELFSSSMKIHARTKKAKKRKKTESTESKVASEANEPDVKLDATNTDYESFYIQITPHHNGEVFLSKKAVNENPKFFGFPFTGLTTPKKGSAKPPYPQRDPDPVVNLQVFGKNNQQILSLKNYNLNTVFYEPKKEIRITCSPLVQIVPEYSLLIMNKPKTNTGIDYEMVIHTPDSPYYEENLVNCTKKMPTGGVKYKDGPLKGQSKPPRHYGWSTTHIS